MLQKLRIYYQLKITKHLLLVRNLLLLLAVAYTIFLVTVTLIDLSGVPSLGSSFDDKIYHFLAYSVLGVLWVLFFKTYPKKLKIWGILVWLLLFGITLEVIQNKLNPNRTYDIIDLLANCFGVVFGTLLASRLNIFKLN